MGIEESEIRRFSQILNYEIMRIPFKYLGMNVGGNPRRQDFWEPVINKLKKRIIEWEGRQLSFVGRLSLIKSIITTIPLYYMAMFKMHNCVSHKITKIQRKFLWGWGIEYKRITWVQWQKLCQTKEEGGLGIKDDIKLFNIALLGNGSED